MDDVLRLLDGLFDRGVSSFWDGFYADRDKGVQKAVGWALREACRSDAAAVFALLKKHQAAMPRAVLRESARKLSASRRAALGVG